VTLPAGTRVGPYEVLSALGAGGMGEVYRARDTKLGRDVAIKVLPDAVASDPERLARFDREAQVLAALNHPNIAHIHGYDESSAIHALVMELVDGPTLADRIAQGPMPLVDVLSIAKQIADGLEAAHEQGIIHRDLKPANIKVRADGTVKILDFGLAKLTEVAAAARHPPGGADALSMSPTITTPAMVTGVGVILGTAAYMSPEQARGKSADRRADVWAFGCVLYEMLVGRRAFGGDDVSHVLARVIEREPDWKALPADTPPSIRRLLTRCFKKDPKERLQAIGDCRLEILEASTDSSSAAVGVNGPNRVDGRLSLKVTVAAVAIAATVAVLGTWLAMRVAMRQPPPSIARVLVGIAPADRLLSGYRRDASMNEGRPSRTSLVFSNDGQSLVFSAERNGQVLLYVRRLDQPEAKPIPGTEGAINPFLSPDGQSVGFYADGALKRASLSGAPVVDVCKVDVIYGATWTSSDEIVFALETGGLWRVPAGGGTPRPATMLLAEASERSHRLPHMLPDGTTVVFTVKKTRFPSWDDDTLIVAQSLATGQRKVIVQGGADARYVGTGHLVFLRRGTLMAVPFDAKRLDVTGTAVGLVSNVMQSANTLPVQLDSGAGQFAISESGSLVYATGGVPSPDRWTLVWVDRTGTSENLPLPPAAYAAPRLSPDGRRLAYHTTSGDWDLWTYDLSRGIAARIKMAGEQSVPVWTPDDSRLAFSSNSGQAWSLFLVNPDGTGSPELLMTAQGGARPQPNAWTPDGKTLAAAGNDRDLWIVSRDQSIKPRVAVKVANQADFSPDGRWLAYAATPSDADQVQGQVYVQPYPALDRREQISTHGGLAPVWRRDGRELYYLENASGDGPLKIRVMAVSVTTTPTFSVGVPQQLFEGRYRVNGAFRNWDVTQDGQRFLMLQEIQQPAVRVSELVLVTNWSEELKRLAPAK
jgi:serine/threonine protein kinase/Tol biopolymer transport system component